MDTENTQNSTDTLLTLVVTEVLLDPGFGSTWIKDLAIDHDLEITDSQVELVGREAIRTLDQLAMPFVESLPEPYRTTYREALEARAAELHPLGDGHGKDIEL